MMKLTIVLCAVLLAFVAQGSQALSLSEALESASQKTQGIISDVIAKAEEVIAEARAKAAQFGEELQSKIAEFLGSMEKRVKEVVEKINGRVNEIVGDLSDPNLSQCRRLAGEVRDGFLAVIESDKKCVTDKLEAGKGYVAEISTLASQLRAELKELREEARRCTENIDGLKATAGAIICVNKVGLTALWISAKRIPEATAVSAKFGFLVNTLPVTLPYCASKNGFNVATEHVEELLGGVKECVKEAVSGGKQPAITTVRVTSELITDDFEPITEITESVTEEETPSPLEF